MVTRIQELMEARRLAAVTKTEDLEATAAALSVDA
jgi:hypothetical protein